MDERLMTELERLRADYAIVAGGESFSHFYCPILFRDEDAELCKGHIVNQAFEKASRAWTVQRADVDSFFGRCFEGDFVDIQYRNQAKAGLAIFDKDLSSKFKPSFSLNGEIVPHYLPTGPVPKNHSLMLLEGAESSIRIALKLAPGLLAGATRSWEIKIEKDLRIPALVSLIKAAHLTMFKMFGYRYCFSAGGHLVGRTILGDFFLKNNALAKTEAVVENAVSEMTQYANMVRPMLAVPDHVRGTIEDGDLYLCVIGDLPWAMMVFIRIAEGMHVVVVPVLEYADASARFLSFLKNAGRVEVRRAKYVGGQVHFAQRSEFFQWPEANVS